MQATQSRWWIGTLNNPKVELMPYLESFQATYAIGQPETGKDGTYHYQFCLNFSAPKRLAAMKKICSQAHFEPCKSEEASVKYCSKDDTKSGERIELGTCPFKRNDKRDWDRALTLAKEGKIDEIPADIQIRYYKNLKAIEADARKPQESTEETKGIWIYGKSGSGKSSTARKLFPEHYIKAQNKWWDGYKGQPYVILDDFDRNGEGLGHYLKTWADHYPCPLEIKGSSTQSNYIKFIITSQYKPYEIWDDSQLIEAIQRRFIMVKPTGPFGDIERI